MLWYLTNKGEHTVLYKININAYIKTQKQYVNIILYSLRTTPTKIIHQHSILFTHTHTYTHQHTLHR